MKKTRTLGKIVGFEFGIMVLVIVIIEAVSFFEMRKVETVVQRVVALRAPTAEASLSLLNGINHSLAALRGWMILEQDRFRQERNKAWRKKIQTSVNQMKRLSKNWTDPQNISRLGSIKEKLNDFKKYQEEIEKVAHSEDNLPASIILFKDAAPRAKIIAESITEMVEIEKTLEASKARKHLLGVMADFRGSLGLSLAAIRAYLIAGDEKFQQEFEKQWAINTKSFFELNKIAGNLINQQQQALSRINKIREEFAPLPSKMFKIRGGDEWNLANLWLKTKAAPVAFEIKEIIEEMTGSQKALLKDDLKNINDQMRLTEMISLILVLIGVGFSIFLARSVTKTIIGPVREAVQFSDTVAGGDYSKDIDIAGAAEIEALGDALKRMQTQILERNDAIQESEAKSRIIVETAVDGIITITEEGIVQTVNQAVCDTFGYLKEEIIGQNVKMLMPDPYRREHDGYLGNYKKTGTKKIIGSGREVEGMRKDKKKFPVYLTIAEVQLKKERLFAGVIRDISEIKQRENELRESAREKEEQLWMINAKNMLGDKMRGAADITALCHNTIRSLSTILKADIGAVYAANSNQTLKLAGSYAFKDRENNFNEFKLGEGLVGQAALKKETILLSEIPENSVKINHGFGEVLPRNVLIAPIFYEEELMAVVTLGAVNEFSEQQRVFLEQSGVDIGIYFNLTKSQERVKNLLAEQHKGKE